MNRTLKVTRRAWLYFLEHPGVALAFSLGCGTGLLLRLPFFPWVLPPDASNVFGAALGALIGAGAAAVIASAVAGANDRRSRAAVAAAVGGVTLELINLARKAELGADATHLYSRGQEARREISKAFARLEVLGRASLYANAGLQIADAQIALNGCKRELDEVLPEIRKEIILARKEPGRRKKDFAPLMAYTLVEHLGDLARTLGQLGAPIPPHIEAALMTGFPDAGDSSTQPQADAVDPPVATPPAAR